MRPRLASLQVQPVRSPARSLMSSQRYSSTPPARAASRLRAQECGRLGADACGAAAARLDADFGLRGRCMQLRHSVGQSRVSRQADSLAYNQPDRFRSGTIRRRKSWTRQASDVVDSQALGAAVAHRRLSFGIVVARGSQRSRVSGMHRAVVLDLEHL